MTTQTWSHGVLLLRNGITIEADAFVVTGASTVVALLEDLTYDGDLTLGAGAHFDIQTGHLLTLGGMNSISGAIGGGPIDISGGTTTIEAGGGIYATTLTVSGANTDLAVDETFDFPGAFDLIAGATLTVANASDVFVTNAATTLSDATIDGLGRFASRGDETAVSSLTVGGSILWEDEGTVTQSGGDVTFAGKAQLLIATGSTYDITDDSNITTGIVGPTNRGLFEKTGGLGTTTISGAIAGQLFNDGTVEVSSGTLDFKRGVAGAGNYVIAGDSTLEFDEAGDLSISFSGSGGTLAIAAPNMNLIGGTISGFDTLGSNDTIKTAAPWTYLGFVENAAHTQGVLRFTDNRGSMPQFTLVGDHAPNSFHAAISAGVTSITYS